MSLEKLARLETNTGYHTESGFMRVEQIVERDPKDAGGAIHFSVPTKINTLIFPACERAEAHPTLMQAMKRFRFLALHNVTLPENLLDHQRAADSRLGSATVRAHTLHPDIWEKYDLDRNTSVNQPIPVDELALGYHTDGYPYVVLFSPNGHTRPQQDTEIACKHHIIDSLGPHGSAHQVKFVTETIDPDYRYSFPWVHEPGTALIVDNGFRINPTDKMSDSQKDRIRDIRIKHASAGGRNGLISIPLYRKEL